MKETRAGIRLADLGIASVKIHTGLNETLVIEVPGADSANKADTLAARLAELAQIKGEGFKIQRPTKLMAFRLWGFEQSFFPKKIAAALAAAGGCKTEVKIGPLQKAPRGLSTATARCALTAAIKAAAEGCAHIGWTRVGVELLPARPLICYQCLEPEHVAGQCRGTADRSRLCYRCGHPDHRAAKCDASAHCIVCAKADRPANHRLGGHSCKVSFSSSKRKGGEARRKGKRAKREPPRRQWRKRSQYLPSPHQQRNLPKRVQFRLPCTRRRR